VLKQIESFEGGGGGGGGGLMVVSVPVPFVPTILYFGSCLQVTNTSINNEAITK
jgi:hypothetical protein